MPLHFRYEEVATLPALAWCARVDRDSDAVRVLHGSGVETHPRGFMEGAWDGAFRALAFTDATIVCGTGGRLDDERVRFTASTDQSGPLFSVAKPGSIYVANSPAFVLAAADEAPDDIYPFYPYDLLRIFRRGLPCPHGQVRLASASRLGVHYNTILSVDRHGGLAFASHRLCESPSDYRSYAGLLADGVRAVVANAADPARRRRYRPLVTLSQGYDSTAAAVLARSAGCTEAISFVDTRRPEPDADSGAENAQRLGMACRVYGRWQYLDLGGCAEAEFGYAATACSVPLVAAEDQLANRILIGGEAGDSVWNPQHVKACAELARPWIRYTMGLSPIEFRLRLGYFMFAPACIAARHNRAIYDIAVSAEMRPWSIGGDYDRPIPRRIAEEAGLERNSFGMRKLASSHTHLVWSGRFAGPALDDYRRFVEERHTGIAPEIYRYWRTRVQRRHKLWDIVDEELRHPRPASAQPRFPTPLRVPWEFMFTFQWTVASMRGRYAAA